MRARHELYVTRGVWFLGHRGQPYPSPRRAPGGAVQLLHLDSNGGGGVAIVCGTFDGPVDVTIEVCGRTPAWSADEWEHVEQLSLTSTGRDLVVGALEEVEHPFPVLPLSPDDRYGVRIAARGVLAAADAGEVDVDAEPVEHHLVQMWRERSAQRLSHHPRSRHSPMFGRSTASVVSSPCPG